MKRVYVIGIDQMIMPLTRRIANEGLLPNIQRLLNEGAANQALPSFPAWTPTNWATIATGADTGTHGVFGWSVSSAPAITCSSFNSLAVNAETIWEAAERAGMSSAIIHYPASMPSRLKKGFVVEGDARPHFGGSPYEITPSQCYTTLPAIPAAERIELITAIGWSHLPPSQAAPLQSSFRILTKVRGEEKILHLLIVDSAGCGYDRALVCREKDADSRIAETEIGRWSNWVFEDFVVAGRTRTGTLRFKLVECSPDGTHLRLYRSQVMPTDGFTEPQEIGPELIDRFGPYLEHVSEMSYISGATDLDTCVEEAEYQAQWIARAGKYLMNQKGCSLFFCHWHFLDDLNHHHLAHLDPSWPAYDESEAEHHWDIVRKTYGVVDRMVGAFMEDLDEDTYLVLISDHGNLPIHRTVSLEKLLYDKGWLVVKDDSLPLSAQYDGWYENIDWDKTKAYLKQGWSREPYVCIHASADEFERVQNGVIRDLRTFVDEGTGKTPFAIVLSKRDASLLGCWGDQVGDIVVVLEGGYKYKEGYTYEPTERKKVVEPISGVVTAAHGWQLMTVQTGVASHLAMFCILGPGIKRGYQRPVDRLGHIQLKDVVPTLCHLLGIQPPAQSQGSVAYDLSEGHEMLRNRPRFADQPQEIDHRIWTQIDMFDFSLLKQAAVAECQG